MGRDQETATILAPGSDAAVAAAVDLRREDCRRRSHCFPGVAFNRKRDTRYVLELGAAGRPGTRKEVVVSCDVSCDVSSDVLP